MVEKNLLVSRGSLSPLGSSETPNGINFSFISGKAEKAEIHIFAPGISKPFFIAPLAQENHRTEATWHACIENLKPPFEYAYKVFYSSKWSNELLDPYAKGVSSPAVWGKQENFPSKARFFRIPSFDWQGVKKPSTPFKEWIIYEMHVRGFSQHKSSNSKKPGTFLGIIEKIPYLKSLGVNAVELLPIFEFNECENHLQNPTTHQNLFNFWGYSTVHFFCPMQRYASSEKWEAAILEFKEMVRELHKNNIAVILDVVYNHTAEKGRDSGLAFSFRGFDENDYYMIDPEGNDYNFSGTGNTFNSNHPTVASLIVDSLIYWTQEMQVDGFRFDLASILTRASDGTPLESPPVVEAMNAEPLLKEAHLIAEAWDAGGLYQVGSFPGGNRWSEWNGKFRDITRNFIKGTSGFIGEFAEVLCGSQNLYSGGSPLKSINFVTAHDGYSLHDLVSYQDKHNLANGEENRDGDNNNSSWNCGAEGPTTNKKILALRKRQLKNFSIANLLSLGVPMILMGDEYAHTRNGNNNTYCQDNELNWFLWDALEKNQEFFLFVQKLIAFRKQETHLFCREEFLTDADVVWHGERVFHPDWHSGKNLIAYTLKDPLHKFKYFFAFNAQGRSAFIQLPNLADHVWTRIVDTSLESPYDFIEEESKRPRIERSYLLSPHSAFIAKSAPIF